jgi:hypothetical protein
MHPGQGEALCWIEYPANVIAPGPIDTEGLRQELKGEKVLGFLRGIHTSGGEVGGS